MKKLLLVVFVFSISLWSCSDEEEQLNDDNTDNQTIENTQIEDNTEEQSVQIEDEQQEPKLDADYKVFLTGFKNVQLPYSLNPEQDDVSGKISLEKQIKYLAKAEDLEKADFEEMAEYTDFFFVSNPVRTSKYSAIVYARFEMGSTYYFLCTYNNDGELIAHIDFAAYQLMGIGPQAGQEFNTKGKISSDFKVSVKFEEETTNYQIKENGEIEKL